MRNLIKLLGLAIVAANLVACSDVEKIGAIMNGKEIAIVFLPFEILSAEGQIIKIVGTDECPQRDPAMTIFFGPASVVSGSKCIVVDHAKNTVVATLDKNNSLTTEEWRIIRHKEKLRATDLARGFDLIRPDGTSALDAHRAAIKEKRLP